MRKNNQMIGSGEFLELLKKNTGTMQHESLVVEGNLTITGEEMRLERIALACVTFMGHVTVRNFSKGLGTFTIDYCNFPNGLIIEANSGGYLLIRGVKAKGIKIWQSSFDSANFVETSIEKILDISGLRCATKAEFKEVSLEELELYSPRSSSTANIAKVITDDPVIATQFRLAGVPVFMSTEAVRKALETGAIARALAA
jgi:hypothetical protein